MCSTTGCDCGAMAGAGEWPGPHPQTAPVGSLHDGVG